MIYSTIRPIVAIFSIASLIGCASSGTSIEGNIDLTINPVLQAQIARHRPISLIQVESIAIDGTEVIDHKMNLGRIDKSQNQQLLRWQPDGQLFSTTTSIFQTPNQIGEGVETSTSICGLIRVLSEGGSKIGSEQTTAVPSGKGFIPFGFTSNSKVSSRTRLVSFSTSTPNVCAPVPGTSFEFKSTTEEQRSFAGSFISSNKVRTISNSVSCSIDNVENEAAKINTNIPGKYLLTTCTFLEAEKKPRKIEFAYISSYGFYLPLYVQPNDSQSNTMQYTSVRLN